jgi:hypothetical protein
VSDRVEAVVLTLQRYHPRRDSRESRTAERGELELQAHGKYLSYFYTRHDLSIRLAMFFCMNFLAATVTSFVSAGAIEMRFVPASVVRDLTDGQRSRRQGGLPVDVHGPGE